MKLGRLDHIGVAKLGAVVAVILAGCGPRSDRHAPVDPETATFAEILASDLANPELSGALGDRIGVLRARGASIADEMRAAGFKVRKAAPDCEALAYEEPERTSFGVDRTVRVIWLDCTGERAADSKMVVTFGDA